MNRYIIIVLIVIGLGAGLFYVLMNQKTEIQKEYKIVALGDSLTAGYGVDKVDGYPTVLENRLKTINPNVSVINMGVSGDTSKQGLERVQSVIDQKPDIVLLCLGANDLLRSLSPTEAKNNIESIITALQAKGITVVLMGIKTSINSPAAYRKEFDPMYADLAEKYNLVLVPSFLDGVMLSEKYTIADRLHPNKEGYIKIVDENIFPVVKDLVK